MSLPTDLQICCLSDLHGCFNTMVRLLNAAPKPFQLILLGDLIDRGPSSRKVVEFAMANAIPTVMGNHESLALAFYQRNARCANMYDHGVWLDNGGKNTIPNWPTLDKRNRSTPAAYQRYNRDQYLGGRVPDEVLDWMEGLPAYLYPSTQMDANGRRLLASHTGYGLEADNGHWFTALWGRHGLDAPPFPDDGLFRCYGHTPRKAAEITDQYAMIDTGCAYTSKRGERGHLTGMMWPSKALIVQPYDETPVKAAFTVSSGGVITP